MVKKFKDKKLQKQQHSLIKKFHDFVGVWREHIHDELTIHKQFLKKHSLKQHIRDTVRIHHKFLTKLKKL